MTKIVGTHDIPCIDDNDYAAWALYMQCVADTVEGQLVANAAAVENALHRPVRTWAQTLVLAAGSGSGGGGGPVFYTYNFNASPVFGNTLATLNLPGWWHVGFNVRATSSAPVLGNWRISSLAVFTPQTPPALRNMTSGAWAIKLDDIVWESNTTGGEVLYSAADVYNPGDPNQPEDSFGLFMTTGLETEFNGVENVTFNATYWAVYLGDTPTISVA